MKHIVYVFYYFSERKFKGAVNDRNQFMNWSKIWVVTNKKRLNYYLNL